MATLTDEGIKVQITFEKLQDGAGWTVMMHISWNTGPQFRNATRQAEAEGVIGRRLSTHAKDFSEVLTKISEAVSEAKDDLQTFIQIYNNQ